MKMITHRVRSGTCWHLGSAFSTVVQWRGRCAHVRMQINDLQISFAQSEHALAFGLGLWCWVHRRNLTDVPRVLYKAITCWPFQYLGQLTRIL